MRYYERYSAERAVVALEKQGYYFPSTKVWDRYHKISDELEAHPAFTEDTRAIERAQFPIHKEKLSEVADDIREGQTSLQVSDPLSIAVMARELAVNKTIDGDIMCAVYNDEADNSGTPYQEVKRELDAKVRQY